MNFKYKHLIVFLEEIFSLERFLHVFYNKYLETNYIDHPKKELCYYLIGLKRGIRTSFSVLKKSFLRRTLFLKVLLCAFKALSEPVKEARINVEQIFLFNVLLGP